MKKQDTGEFIIPDGFERSDGQAPFGSHSGPYYQKITSENKLIRALHVKPYHLNSMRFLHGGMLMTFADAAMASVIIHETDRPCVTLKMNSEFLSAALEGDWIEAHVDIVRTTKTIAFARGGLMVRGKMIFKCDGVFHFVRKKS
ncbi:PaaI family thioesterase [Sneathiella sp.]|jgi:uncharacterized protein (TIGR00369 family)|uniref:PaaI family thioesterase n=1 Tax=Sneathiella sp. TaxID=1964365 RepID=UPI0025D61EE6|nr:PaaI family thioesterase [Sneathiella sp.]|tara:strand:- start:1264 stop:1695 length:432 start_codon:yes stop_codon:yes gene_type:complete